MRVFLVRHPETEALKNKIIYGNSESPLTDRGTRSIGWAARTLRKVDLGALYCSPLQRCRVLADAICEGRPGLVPIIDERIRELDCGIYEQMTFEQAVAVDQEDATKFLYEFGVHRPRGGENFEDVKARTGPFLDGLAEASKQEGYDGRPIAVVSHAMAIRSMISHLFGYPLEDIWHFDIQTTGILEIEFDTEHRFGRLISLKGPDSAI